MVGTSIENYRIDEILGHGGMGVVYKAMDTSIDRVVALKVMNPGVAANDEFLWRFKSEAKVLGRLIHSNIVNVYAFRHIAPHLFIVMEYVGGGTLGNLIDKKGTISPEEAIPIIDQCLAALEIAHNSNIVHRDIKPQNILLTQDQQVKISDFGLAKIQENTSSTVTRVGVTGGTIYYMPPEQSVALSDVDHRGDLYSLGMTMYQMLAGRMPFDDGSSTLTILKAIDEQRIPTPSSFNPKIPTALANVVMRAIKKERDERFQSAAEMREALLAYQSVAPEKPPVESTKLYTAPLKTQLFSPEEKQAKPKAKQPAPETAPPSSNKNPVLLGIGILALVIAGILGFSLIHWGSPPTANEITASDNIEPAPTLPLDTNVTPPAESLDVNTLPERAPAALAQAEAPAQSPSPPQTPPSTANQATQSESNKTFRVTSSPSGARVFIDGRAVGNTPYTAANLTSKSYGLRISESGHADWEGTFNPGERRSINITLAALEGQVTVVVRPFGDITINGTVVAENTNAAYVANLPAGNHTLQASHAVLGTWKKQISVKPGDSQDLFFNFNVEHTITVISKPLNAEIIVDGVSTNRFTPSQIKLRPGNHTISVQKSGYTPTVGEQEILLESAPSSPISFELQQN